MASCRRRGSGRPTWHGLKIRVGTISFLRSFQHHNRLTVFLPLPFRPIVRFAIKPEPIHLESAARPSSVIVRLLQHKAWHIVVIRYIGGHRHRRRRRRRSHIGVFCSELFISVGAVMVVDFWVCL